MSTRLGLGPALAACLLLAAPAARAQDEEAAEEAPAEQQASEPAQAPPRLGVPRFATLPRVVPARRAAPPPPAQAAPADEPQTPEEDQPAGLEGAPADAPEDGEEGANATIGAPFDPLGGGLKAPRTKTPAANPAQGGRFGGRKPVKQADCQPSLTPPQGPAPRVVDLAMIHGSHASRGVLQHGRYLYVSGQLLGRDVGAGLSTFDVSDPARIRQTASFSGTDFEPNELAAVGRTLYLAGWNPNSGLQVFDLSQPSAPRLVKTIVTPNYSWTATITGNLLDIGLANETRSGIVTYDISSPQNPKQIWSLDVDERGGVGRPARVGGYLYFGRDDSLWIMDASDPAHPEKVAEFPCGANCGDAVEHDGLLFMNTAGVLRAFDVSKPLKPRLVGSLKLEVDGLRRFQGDDLFLPASGSGVYWIDASDPRKMRVVSNFGVAWDGMGHGGYAISAGGRGDYAFIGTTSSGSPFAMDSLCWGARIYSVALKAPAKR